MKNMKNLKVVLIASVLLILIGIGAVLSLKKITSKPKKDVVNLFEEDNTNETIELLDNTNSALDDIFGNSLSNEDKALLALTNSSEEKFKKTESTATPTLNNTNKLEGTSPLNDNRYALMDNTSPNSMKSEKDLSSSTSKVSSPTTKSSEYYSDEGDSDFPPFANNASFDPKKVYIKSFIIDYNKTLTVSKTKPVFITLAIKTPEDGRYAKVRVYARRLSAKNEILSRDLIFSLPRIRVIDSQAQTQFYFVGRSAGRKQLMKGRYILYAEAEITDRNGKSVGKTGRYPLPKWDYIITLK